MKEKKEEIIISERNNSIFFPNKNINGPVLVIGHQYGMFGTIRNKELHAMENIWDNSIQILFSSISSSNKLIFVIPEYVSTYVNRLLSYAISRGWFTKKQVEKFVEINSCATEPEMLNKLKEKYTNMKFDYIIQNPPYNKSLHLDFFEKGLDMLSDKGRMVIIEPATWLINIRKNGKGKRYDAIKKRIEGHVEMVVIENLNKEFGTKQDVPFATTTIDMSRTFDTIEFVCCGEHMSVKSIYDCNLIGDYETISGILEKCKGYSEVMDNHYIESKKCSEKENLGLYFYPFTDGLLNALGTNSMDMLFSEPNNRVRGFHKCGEFGAQYLECLGKGEITYNIVPVGERGSKYHSIYGTKEELENWKHFIFNNKLPLFLNIVLTIDQHNNSKPYIPWLVDKQYTDEEINNLFGFTDEEVKLINKTIEKYERNSPWFRRYMVGPDGATDEEVQNFIDKLNEKYA